MKRIKNEKHSKNNMEKLVGNVELFPAIEKNYFCRVSAKRVPASKMVFINMNGLGKLVQKGIDAFEKIVGKNIFPNNFVWSEGMWSGDPTFRVGSACHENWHTRKGMYVSAEVAEDVLSEYARIGGWIKAAAELPAVKKMLVKNLSPRGVNSLATKINLQKIVERFPSPHKLEKMLWATRERTQSILGQWGDYTPSWLSIISGLMRRRQVGKAAVIATALMLDANAKFLSFGERTFREARNFLIQVVSKNFQVEDNSDGVFCRIEEEEIYSNLGIKVYRARYEEEWGKYRPLLLVRNTMTKESYHCNYGKTAQQCVVNAIAAWKRERELRNI